MYEEPDKLSWGLVRDELRRTFKKRDETELEFLQSIKGDFYKNGFLNDASLKRAKGQVERQLQTNLSAFAFDGYRSKMATDGGYRDVRTCYFWDYTKMGVNVDGERHHDEQMLILQHAAVSVGKKDTIGDLLSCFIMVGEHALYRMVQRGMVNRDPLAFLSQHAEEWISRATLLMMNRHFLQDNIGSNVFIPFAGGALLGKIANCEMRYGPQGWSLQKARIKICPRHGSTVNNVPYAPLLEVEEGEQHVTLQFTTWIPESMFYSEQWWAKYRFDEFYNEFKDIFNLTRDALHNVPKANDPKRELIAKGRISEFGPRMAKMIGDRRWAQACNWP